MLSADASYRRRTRRDRHSEGLPIPMNRVSRLSQAAILAGTLATAACQTLPASGPTAARVRRGAREDAMGFRIVDIDANAVATLNAETPPARPGLSTLAETARNDAIGPGDTLLISVFEVGASLFAGASTAAASADPGARNATFPPVTVDREGAITLPFVGRIAVAGRTPTEVQHLIERGLAGKSQNPQVLVAVRDNVANRVFVSGDVKRTGAIELTLGNERLTDAIAMSNGPTFTFDDMIVRLHRGGRVAEEWLADLTPGSVDDVVLVPGDRIEVLHRPRSFTVFGATAKVSQVPFENNVVSIAEAVARIGGPADTQADPKAVYLFRYAAIVGPNGIVSQPVIYRLDMMNPASYFLAQKFMMRDKDVIYIANAAAVQPSKLVAVINQLFSPVFTARAIAN
jgi:polysaccharide export outer membrane protein